MRASRIVLAVVCLAALSAGAAEQSWRPDAAFTQVGAGDATESWSMGWQWHLNREWHWGRSLALRGHWEVALGRWRTELNEDGRDHAWITQVGVVPSLRLSSTTRHAWYAELGSGPTFLLPVYRSRDRRFSTEFNFQSHLAVGYVLGERGEHDLGLRIDHFSNAGIREPNPGINLASFRYTYRL